MKQSMLCRLLGGAILLAGSVQAPALTTLQVEVADLTCRLNGASVDCHSMGELMGSGWGDAWGFQATLHPGEGAEVSATVRYEYHDDGLPLPLDMGAAFQTEANGFEWVIPEHEAGAIYPLSNNCSGSRYCVRPPWLNLHGNQGFPPLLLGLNDTPDALSGEFQLTGGLWLDLGAPYPVTEFVWIEPMPMWFSSPIPEPGTGALVLGALLLTSAALRRGSPIGTSRPALSTDEM